MSDEQLWRLMFGATIPRSWMVCSNGHCPACDKPVPMYDWKIDALKEPVEAPLPALPGTVPEERLREVPRIRPRRARRLRPEEGRPLAAVQRRAPRQVRPDCTPSASTTAPATSKDGKRWRFIPAYLVYGQWKQAVQRGIKPLATAYVLTGDADLRAQGRRPARPRRRRVSDVRLQDAGHPLRERPRRRLRLGLARRDDRDARDGARVRRDQGRDRDATRSSRSSSSTRASSSRRRRRRRSPADVLANIETRILRDAIANPHKIYSNFPQE